MGYAIGMLCGVAMIVYAGVSPGHDFYGYWGLGLILVAAALSWLD